MLRPGAQIGPYTLTNKLGRGTFGVVWLAEKRTPLATTKVALKIPLEDELDLEEIKQEAALWARVSGHPNVIPIIEANIYGEHIVIASEYASDGSLQDWLNRHGGAAPSIESAVKIMLGILDGLEHLHTRQIIHRDLKPANLLLQGETPRIADFGISRLLKTTSQSVTVAGTYAYMAPEAFDGKRNEQTDIWAAGVIFYQMLAGRLPFPQKDVTSLMGAILTKYPEPLPLSVSGNLQMVIARSLDKQPAQRFKSVAEMRAALWFAIRQDSFPVHDTVPDRRDRTHEQVRRDTPVILPRQIPVVKTPLTRRLTTLKVFTWIQLFCTVVAITAAFIDIESIVISGAVLFLVGLGTTICGIYCQLVRAALLGVSVIPIITLCFALIAINEWSPSEAQEPISAIIFTYSVLLILPLAMASLVGIRTMKKRALARPANELQQR